MINELDEKKLSEYVDSLFQEDKLREEDLKKKLEYSALFTEYLEKNNRDVVEDYRDIVPLDFEISDDIETKIKVLQDAISNGFLIEQSSIYPSLLEGPVPEIEDPSRSI